MKIIINNFQSIEHAELDIPEKSFTCIVGATDIGKSAVRRAFECVLFNKSEVSYIRKGTKECSVQIIFDDGMDISWFRNKKTSWYQINGDDSYKKLNQTVPAPIVDKGFRELVLNNEKFNIQIADQYENVFLLDKAGSRVTEVLSNLGNLNKIISANKLCNSDIKDSRSKLKIRREDVFALKEKIKNYSGLDYQRSRVSDLKTFLNDLKDLKLKHGTLSKMKDDLDEQVILVKKLIKAKDLKIKSFDLDTSSFFDLKKLYSRYLRTQNVVNAYKGIQDISRIEFTLEKEYELFLKVNNLYNRFSNTSKKCGLYGDIPPDIESFNLDVSTFEKAKELATKLYKSKDNLITLRERLEDVNKELEGLREEEKEIHKEIKICPICEKDFTE